MRYLPLLLALAIQPLHADDLGAGMDLEYGQRGLSESKLQTTPPRSALTPGRIHYVQTGAKRVKPLSVKDLNDKPSLYLGRPNLRIRARIPEFKSGKPLDGRWATSINGIPIELTDAAKAYADKVRPTAIDPVYRGTLIRRGEKYIIRLEQGVSFKR